MGVADVVRSPSLVSCTGVGSLVFEETWVGEHGVLLQVGGLPLVGVVQRLVLDLVVEAQP